MKSFVKSVGSSDGRNNKHDDAKAEMREAAAWYEQDRPGLGDRFLATVEKAAGDLLMDPITWQKISGRYRRAIVPDFPYGIIYAKERGGSIYIAAVMHLHRRPGYWRERTRS